MAGAEVRHIPTCKYFALLFFKKKANKQRHEGSKKAQPVNRLIAKPDDLSSKPGTHMVDGEN